MMKSLMLPVAVAASAAPTSTTTAMAAKPKYAAMPADTLPDSLCTMGVATPEAYQAALGPRCATTCVKLLDLNMIAVAPIFNIGGTSGLGLPVWAGCLPGFAWAEAQAMCILAQGKPADVAKACIQGVVTHKWEQFMNTEVLPLPKDVSPVAKAGVTTFVEWTADSVWDMMNGKPVTGKDLQKLLTCTAPLAMFEAAITPAVTSVFAPITLPFAALHGVAAAAATAGITNEVGIQAGCVKRAYKHDKDVAGTNAKNAAILICGSVADGSFDDDTFQEAANAAFAYQLADAAGTATGDSSVSVAVGSGAAALLKNLDTTTTTTLTVLV